MSWTSILFCSITPAKLSWGFQNIQNWPWLLNLTKICLRYPRSKTKSNLKHYFGINLLSFTLIFSAKSWSNLSSSDSFKILRSGRFWNCLWLLYFTNICRSRKAKQNIICHHCTFVRNWFLTLIIYPRAISVGQILFSFLRVEIVVRKFWEISAFFLSMYRLIFCQKNFKNLEIVKFLDFFGKRG